MKKALSLVLALMMLMTMCIVPVVAADPDGSAENPYYVTNPMTAPNFITIPANSTVYYQYNPMVFNGWSVEGYGLSAIIVDGFAYDQPDMWGAVCADFNFNMMSPGIVGYVNDSAEEVQVMLTHSEPVGTLNNPDTLYDGDNYLSIPASIMEYVSVFVPMVNGDFTFSTEQAEDFQITVYTDASPAEGGTPIPVENGSLTLTLESYMPVYVVITPVGMTGDVVLNVAPPKAGTADNPHWLEADVLYDVEGTEPVYFQIDGSLAGNTLLIESFNGTDLTVSLDGENYIAENGVLYLPLETSSWVMELVISQAEESHNTVYFSIQYAEGSMENPIDIALGDTVISIPAGDSDGCYYSYVVEQDGLLIATPSDKSVLGYMDMGDESYEHYAYLMADSTNSYMMIPVTVGEVITFSISGLDDEETWEKLPVDITLNLAWKELVLFDTFEDGDMGGWTSSSNLTSDDVEYISGWYSAKFEATADWANMYKYINVEANADYIVSFKAKAANNGSAWVKFHKADWSGDVAQGDINLTTEWADYEFTLNSGDNTSLVFMFQNAGYAADGQIIWLDDIVIIKAEGGDTPVEPPVVEDNLVVNGSFETGDKTGWEIWQSTTISADAAKDGAFGAHLKGNGGWGGMLNQTVTVEAGKQYKLSFWINVNANGVNVQVKDGSGTAIQGAGGWFDANNKDKLVEWIFTAPDNTVLINFCGAGNKIAEDVYVDNIVLQEIVVVEPSYDGYITNGDFETGLVTPWDNLWGSCPSVEIVEGGKDSAYALSVVSKQWCHVRQAGIAVEANTNYKITVWAKNANNMCLLVKDGADTKDIVNVGVTAGDEWTEFVVEFNSGDYTSIIFSLMGGEGEDQYGTFDNIVMEKVDSVPEITYGDLDGNGKITNRDLALLQQKINGWEVEIDEAAADVDGNGKLTNRDLALLQQFINGWDVTLGG